MQSEMEGSEEEECSGEGGPLDLTGHAFGFAADELPEIAEVTTAEGVIKG